MKYQFVIFLFKLQILIMELKSRKEKKKKVNLTRERCGSEGKLMKEKVAREGAGDES